MSEAAKARGRLTERGDLTFAERWPANLQVPLPIPLSSPSPSPSPSTCLRRDMVACMSSQL